MSMPVNLNNHALSYAIYSGTTWYYIIWQNYATCVFATSQVKKLKALMLIHLQVKPQEKFDELLVKMISKYGVHQNAKKSSPEQDYLLWAVLGNRMDLACIFWRAGKVRNVYQDPCIKDYRGICCCSFIELYILPHSNTMQENNGHTIDIHTNWTGFFFVFFSHKSFVKHLTVSISLHTRHVFV